MVSHLRQLRELGEPVHGASGKPIPPWHARTCHGQVLYCDPSVPTPAEHFRGGRHENAFFRREAGSIFRAASQQLANSPLHLMHLHGRRVARIHVRCTLDVEPQLLETGLT